MYRLAFTSQDVIKHFIYDDMADAILDCPYPQMDRPLYPGLIGMYTYLTNPAASGLPIFVNSAPEFAGGDSLASGNHGWNIEMGWRGPTSAIYPYSNLQGHVSGPLVVCVSQEVAEADRTGDEFVKVAEHPDCGPLLQVYTYDYTAKMFIRGGTMMDSSAGEKCPLPLNSTMYSMVVEDLARDKGIPSFQASTLNETMPFNQTFYALLLARISNDTTLLLDPAPLRSSGILRDPERAVTNWQEECSETSRFVGETWETDTHSFSALYQFLATSLIALWGVLLLVASWPFKSLVIKGSLDQWMSFGADIGRENMLGSSSGHAGANDTRLWRLSTEEEDNDTSRICMVKGARDDLRTRPILKMGRRYV